MDPTWNWANYGQIHAQANYYAAARQLRGAQSASTSGQTINASAAQNHHSNQNQMSSYPQNQMSWFALHGPHAHPGFNPSVHQANNHADPTAFATNPFGIHAPQSAAHPTVASYDSGFLTGFQTAAATAAAKANYLQPNHANFKQLTAKDYEMNLRAAGFAHPHCGAMQSATHGTSMTHPDTSGMSATGAHIFSHLTPTSWRHHPNLMATHNHGVSRTGAFGPLPHEETNLMQTRTAHHAPTSSMSAHSNSSGHSNKSCSVESSKQLQHHQKHSSAAFFNQTVHSTGSRTSASSFDHFPSPKLAHHNQPQPDHHYLAMQAAAAAVQMAAAPNQHMLSNSRTSTQCQYPSMNFPGADILMAVGSAPSMSKHSSNNQCHVRGAAVAGNNNYCNLMMPNINNYSQSHPHASVSMSGSVANHNTSRSSSAASNHALQQGSESSSGSYGYNSPSTNHPHSPYQQRNTASVAPVSVSSQATTVTAVAANVSNGVQDFTGTSYINQNSAYGMSNSATTSTRIDYPTPPSSAQIVPQTQPPGASQGQEDSLGHYPTTQQNSGNSYPSNSYSPYQTASKLSSTTGGPGSNNSVVSNAGSSSCMVEAAARAAAASNNSNSSAGYHHNPLSAHSTSLSESDADACLSNIVNVTPISDGMSEIAKLNDSQMNSTLNDVLSGQGINFQSINYNTSVDQAVNFTPTLRIDGQTTTKKKNKVKKHKKKEKAKANERISMNSNNPLSFNLSLHYNYNEPFANQSCNSYSTGMHQTQTTDQQIHSQSNMLPMNSVAESSQCFDPSTLNMQTNLIDNSLTAHLNPQQQQQQPPQHSQHSQPQQQQPQQQQPPHQQQNTQRSSIEFDKSQQHNAQRNQPLVNHQIEANNNAAAVLQQNEENLVNDKDLISDLDDDLSFLTEATECEPPSSNDIGTQAGTQLITETVTTPVIETSSVATSTECTPVIDTCPSTAVISPVVDSSNNGSNNVGNVNNANASSKQTSTGFQQSYFKFVPNSENSTDISLSLTQTNVVKNDNALSANHVCSKKKKHKETKEKNKTVETLNGVKPSKSGKSNKCDNVEENAQRDSKSLLNKVVDSKPSDSHKLVDCSAKRTNDREHEAKFFKVRPTLNVSTATLNAQIAINTSSAGLTKEEKSRKRRAEEYPAKNTHDEYEFPDSPNPSMNKKSKKVNSTDGTTLKKKVSEKSASATPVTKKVNNSVSKNKSTINSTQSSVNKQPQQQNNVVTCDNLKNDLKHSTNNSTTNCSKTETVNKTEKRLQESVEKQDHNPPIKQKSNQPAAQHQQPPQLLPPLPAPLPPPSQPPPQQLQPQQQQQQLQQTKKVISNDSKCKKETSSSSMSTSAHLVSKTSQCVSVQSAGTNTPRRRSQDKKALTIREGLMRTGDFVVSLDEVNCELPMIWRIEGKSLLQRFEPSEQDSIIVYTNTSSYSAWNPTVRQRYTGVDVRIMGCSRTKIVVEKLGLTKTNPSAINGETPAVERCLREMSSAGSSDQQQENFEVFIQTLVSQALDPNFIAEIVKENDDYFLSHVQAIDEYCGRKKSRFFSKVKWDANVVKCVETFPTFTIIPQNNVGDLRCRLCHDNWSTQIMHFSGDPYDQMTLECKEPVDVKQTKYAACDQCKDRITLFSRLHHQKYNFYVKCKDKVEEMRAGDENKESHIILEQCLQDTEWIQSLFKQLEKIWVECDEMR